MIVKKEGIPVLSTGIPLSCQRTHILDYAEETVRARSVEMEDKSGRNEKSAMLNGQLFETLCGRTLHPFGLLLQFLWKSDTLKILSLQKRSPAG